VLAHIDDASERDADRVALGIAPPAVMRASAASMPSTPQHTPASVYAAIASPGRPLDAATRAYFEPRFGVDLHAVRIHDEPRAIASASDVSARAYTVGTDVVLAEGGYRNNDPMARTLLAHELAHVMQHATDRSVLRRYPDCRRLLPSDNAQRGGPRVPERSVQEFLADELEPLGNVVRELQVPAGSARPWRSEGRPGDDTVIDPQIIDEGTRGSVDIALMAGVPILEFLEVKEATWGGMQFAEHQLLNYVTKANGELPEVERLWRRRGYPTARVTSVVEMPAARYATPAEPTVIGGQQVMLAWCRSGVILFKTLDVDNEELLYCGISDKGRTDAFIGRILDQAEEAVARALARRLREMSLGPVNVNLLLQKVREKLRATIRWLLKEVLQEVCAAALEVTLASLLAAFKQQLFNKNLLDGLLIKLTPQGEGVDLHLGEAAAKTAGVLTVGLVIDTLMGLVFAL
jgi:hypothetical protein